MSTRATGFSDVCGAMDELKRLVVEEPARVAAGPEEAVRPLVEDALGMVGRMQARIAAYGQFREQLRGLLAALDHLPAVSDDSARRGVERIEAWLGEGGSVCAAGVAEVHAAAEEIRSVASAQENALRQGKDLALRVHGAFDAVRDGRPWLLEEEERGSMVERLRRQYQAWLPPEPAAGIMLDWLARDRLVVRDGGRQDRQPVVLFDDGGAIPMSQLRWSPELGNFHPANTVPGSSGRSYRGAASAGHRVEQASENPPTAPPSGPVREA